MFSIARRSSLALPRQCSRSISLTATRWKNRKVEDIYPEDDNVPVRGQDAESGSRRSWADRLQKEPLEAGTPSDNPHLNAMFHLAKETEAQRVDQDLKVAATNRVSDAWKRSASLRLYNIPESLQEADLVELFGPYGEVSYVRIGVIGSLRMGMVSFTTPGSADRAVQVHEYTPIRFDNQELTVRYGSFTRLNPPSRTIFCSNFVPDTDEALRDRLTYLFNPWAKAQRIRHMAKNNICFIDFESVEDAQKVIDRHELRPFRDQGGPILRLNFAVDKPGLPPNHTLCITNYSGEAEDLEGFFPEYEAGNHIVQMHSVPDSQGERPPTYFVRFESEEYATNALRQADENTKLPFKARYAAKRSNSRPPIPRRDRLQR